ncbi:MAG: hypothetical protein RL418_308 [Actinomycetota bacterium]|jgi:hypothetical protein
MKTKRLVGLALIGLWWVSVNLAWVEVGNQSLTGGELAPVLNLLPAIAGVSVFISMYGKFTKLLGLFATFLTAIGAWISISTNWQASAAVVEILEQISGVLNADQHASGVSVVVTLAPLVSAGLAIATGLVITWASISTESRASSSIIKQDAVINDPRTLWDEQS